jgi:phenylpropionate dioxygenase-like ring-hydroxylating dioxygenase large terminal subunit
MRQEENELLTRVGAGTPMGNLMRQYWIPACMSSELKPDAPPMRLMLLGEKLIAFRDSSGRVGIMDHRCPHRCASFFFGRIEQDGLRCIYHGWKFDVDGNCLEMPNVPPAHDFSAKVKAKAYKAVERNGLVWAYMGDRKVAPPMPMIEPTLLPEAEVTMYMLQRECNWLQALEGDIDTSHFSFLHGGSIDPAEVDPEAPSRFVYLNPRPEYHVTDTEWGTMYAAHRPADPGETYYRVAHFVFPFWTLIPDGQFSDYILGEAWVPMDDTHTMMFQVKWNVTRASARTLKSGKPVPGLAKNLNYMPQTTDWYGRWRHIANAGNDYMVDREAQRTSTFSGLSGVDIQDQAITESMGKIVDRTLENPAVSDRMIIRTRRRLIEAAQALKNGVMPPSVDNPECVSAARSGDFIAPAALDWREAYARQMKAAKNPTGLLRAAE